MHNYIQRKNLNLINIQIIRNVIIYTLFTLFIT